MTSWIERQKAYEADLREDPTNTNCVYNFAWAMMMTVETGEAATLDSPEERRILAQSETLLRKVVEATDGRHGSALAILGRICLLTDRSDEAIRCLEPVLSINPTDASDLWRPTADNLISLYMEKDLFNKAISLGKRWCEFFPEDAQAHLRLGSVLGAQAMQLGDVGSAEEAIFPLRRAMELGHPEAEGVLQEVEEFLQTNGAVDTPAREQSHSVPDLQVLALQLQQDVAATMNGPESPEEKMRRVTELQQRFQTEIRRLTNG